MSKQRTFAMVLLLGIVISAIYVGSSRSKDEELAATLPSTASPSEDAPSPPSPPRIKRLTNRVIADEGVLIDTWVVRSVDQSLPRIKLPAEPTPDGTLSGGDSDEVVTELATHPGFVGADACSECHRERHQGFVSTAHYNTSQPCDADAILGPLDPPHNQASCDQERLSFELRRRGNTASQVVRLDDWSLSVPMDVIVGSGKLAQTFLYWHHDGLFQLHASYYTKLGIWKASPGLSDVDTDYARPIEAGCLECHVTYIDKKKSPNHFDRGSVIWGVTCERCHGPGGQHVEFHRATPEERQPRFITNPSDLTRERQLDLCGQCHLGEFRLKGRPFAFRPGDRIEEFHEPVEAEAGGDGVHTSNQLTRLQLSECFKHSEMTCLSCHDPHRYQRGDLVAFSNACLDCHELEHCGKEPELGGKIAEDCIRCHMPRVTNIDLRDVAPVGREVSAVDHFIRVPQSGRD